MQIGINLLPLSKKKEIQLAEQFRVVLVWEAVIFSVAVIFFGFVFGVDYLLSCNLKLASDNKIDKSSGAQYETIKYYEHKFSEINSKISKVSSIASDQIYWLSLFSKLESAIPDKVDISGITTNNFSLYFTGKAETRDDLLSLKDNLEKESCFENINLPLSNLVSKENVIFQIDLEIKEECVKNK
jgi:Tfp pilus assembly protein PilN